MMEKDPKIISLPTQSTEETLEEEPTTISVIVRSSKGEEKVLEEKVIEYVLVTGTIDGNLKSHTNLAIADRILFLLELGKTMLITIPMVQKISMPGKNKVVVPSKSGIMNFVRRGKK